MKFDVKLKRIFYLTLLFSSTISAQAFTLTLEESIDLGLKNSKELKISNAKINKAEAWKNEISSSALPSLSLNARYTRFSDVPPFSVDIPILPDPITIQGTYLNSYNLIATIQQPLFTGFRISSLLESAEYMEQAEKIRYTGIGIEKEDDIRTSFWRFYISRQIVSLMQQNLKSLNSHLVNTEKLLKNGLVTKNDLLKLKVEVANIELKLVDAKNNESLAKASFNKSIGLKINTETKIVVTDLETRDDIPELSQLFEEAINNRQELTSGKLFLNSLKEQESAAMSEWYPQLYAFGNFYFNNPNQRFLPLEDKFNDSWDVGVALQWKIWNWGGASAKVDQARQEYVKTDKNLEILSENIQMDVYSKYLNLKKSLKKIDLNKLKLHSAEENYRITEQKYYQQLATSTDLIDAETAFLNSKINLANSKVEYKIGVSALEKSIGRKSEN